MFFGSVRKLGDLIQDNHILKIDSFWCGNELNDGFQ